MPLLRASRVGTGSARKLPKASRKKRLAKKEWDDTVHDLTIHRATPEDLVRRHEMHKSKNKMLVHLEMQEKALKSKLKKQRTPESLRKKRLSLMREILSDQYRLQDVLERSDQTMAMVKDLFGDAPRRHLGFPNVTVAPDFDAESFQGPIIQKCDPPTQLSILSESVMDAQALNDVEGEGSSVCKTGGENKAYLLLKSSTHNERTFEENSVVSCQQEASKQQLPTTSLEEANVLSTPTNVQTLGHSALNATNVVRKVHSRLQNEEQTPDVTYVMQNVLNAKGRKQNQTSIKVKKKQNAPTCGVQKSNLSTTATSFDLSSRNKSNLDVLNQMMCDMEHEMEEFEKLMGLDVQQAHRDQGVSGFTHSLVNAVCRVLRCLKETETRLQQEKMKRQQLERELSEHRALIDALTGEVLLMRKENLSMQDEFQQYLIVTDQQLISLTQAFKEFPVTDSNRTTSPGEIEEHLLKSPKVSQVNPPTNCVEPKSDKPELVQVDFPSKNPVLLNPPDITYPASTLSSCVFQPAVLLSPPQQKSSQALLPFQDESVGRESAEKQRSYKLLVKQEDSRLFTQRNSTVVAPQTSQSCLQLGGQPLASTSSAMPRQECNSCAEEPTSGVSKECTQSDELQGQIAELTVQNSLLKAQLNKLGQCCQGTKHCVQEPITVQDGSVIERQECSPIVSNLKDLPKSLDERIAELNRQSAEARNKLLLLTNQQKLPTFISVSPPVSPIPSPSVNLLEDGRRMIEVSIPVAGILDSSKEDTPSPANGTNGTRSIAISNQMCSPPSTTMRNVQLMYNRKMTEKQREEGWFALSAHIG